MAAFCHFLPSSFSELLVSGYWVTNYWISGDGIVDQASWKTLSWESQVRVWTEHKDFMQEKLKVIIFLAEV